MTEPAIMQKPRAEHIVYGEMLSAQEHYWSVVAIAAEWHGYQPPQPIIVYLDGTMPPSELPPLPVNIQEALTDAAQRLNALEAEFVACRRRGD